MTGDDEQAPQQRGDRDASAILLDHDTFLNSEDERARYQRCGGENLGRPAAIQPHGALVAVTDSRVSAASANTRELIGYSAEELIGRPFPSILVEAIDATDPVRIGIDDSVAVSARLLDDERAVDVIRHRTADNVLILEFEPTESALALSTLDPAVRSLAAPRSEDAIRQHAVVVLRRLLGTDRAVFYLFHDDGHGEVVAEDARDDLEPYLGLHFPASDIPEPARRIYTVKGAQYIHDRDAVPAPIIGPDAATLDLSRAELRAISPHHLDYMRNMDVATSASFAIVDSGELRGMITCSSREARPITYRRRAAARIFTEAVGDRLRAVARTAEARATLRRDTVRARLVEQVKSSDDPTAGLLSGGRSLLDLIDADGAVVLDTSRMWTIGKVPRRAAVEAVLRSSVLAEGRVHSDNLALDHPELAVTIPEISGLMAAGNVASGGRVVWLRRSVTTEVRWLGDPGNATRPDSMSPRASFASWNARMRTRSAPWTTAERDAARRLASDLDELTVRRLMESEIANAQAVQRALRPDHSQMPDGFDVVTSIEAARVISGDFYDWGVISTPTGSRVCVVLGDVMGKGVGAGLLAATARTAFRLTLSRDADLGAAVSTVEEQLGPDLERTSSFITAFAASIDQESGTFSYCDAGHGLAFLARQSGEVEVLQSTDPPIGVGGDLVGVVSRSAASDVLEEGEALIVVSDGVADAWKNVARLREHLHSAWRPALSADDVVRSVRRRLRSDGVDDDSSIVVIRRGAAAASARARGQAPARREQS